MSLTHVTRLLATGAVATALATGGLAFTPQTAHAAQAATTYSCNFGSNGTYNIPVTFALPDLPTAALAGVPIPQQTLVATLSLPAGLPSRLVGNGGTLKAAIENLLVIVGLGELPVSLAGPAATVASSRDGATLVAGGFLGSTTPGTPGSLGFAFPSSFVLGVQKGNGAKVGSYSCTQAAPTPAGAVQVSQQTSKVSGKVVGKVKRDENGRVEVAVQRQVGEADGYVAATLKGKRIGRAHLRHGRAMLKLHTLDAGVWKVKLSYGGDSATQGSSKTITVHVR